MQEIFNQFKGTRNELIPILQKAQEKYGYISKETITEIALFLDLSQSTVYGVVTFFSQFYLERQGKYKIKVCQGTACHVKGGKKIMDVLEQKLGITQGQATKDYKYSLERVACFGSCALAPVMVINDKVYGSVTPKKAEQIIDKLS